MKECIIQQRNRNRSFHLENKLLTLPNWLSRTHRWVFEYVYKILHHLIPYPPARTQNVTAIYHQPLIHARKKKQLAWAHQLINGLSPIIHQPRKHTVKAERKWQFLWSMIVSVMPREIFGLVSSQVHQKRFRQRKKCCDREKSARHAWLRWHGCVVVVKAVSDNGEPGTMTYGRCHGNVVIHFITKVFYRCAIRVDKRRGVLLVDVSDSDNLNIIWYFQTSRPTKRSNVFFLYCI